MQEYFTFFWKILESDRESKLDSLSTQYIKKSFGKFYEKYRYEKNLTYIEFLKLIDSDIKSGRVEELELLEYMSEIYYLHRDFNSTIVLKEAKINKMLQRGISGVEFDYYKLANIYYFQNSIKKAYEAINNSIREIDTNKITNKTLKLYLDSLYMKSNLILKEHSSLNEVELSIKEFENIYSRSKKYLSSSKSDSYFIKLNYLYMEYFRIKKDYKNVLLSGKRAITKLAIKGLDVKISLKYRVYKYMGEGYIAYHEYSDAINIAKKAISLKDELLTIDISSSLNILAESYFALKDYDRALKYAIQLEKDSTKDSSRAVVYRLLSRVYSAQDDIENRDKYFQKLSQYDKEIA